MNGGRGQSTIEVVALVPLVLVLALGVVDAGITVRDRIALADAAGRAAAASMAGRDPVAAARDGLPAALREDVRVDARGDGLEVSVRPSARLARLAGGIRLHTTVVTDAEEAS